MRRTQGSMQEGQTERAGDKRACARELWRRSTLHRRHVHRVRNPEGGAYKQMCVLGSYGVAA
jgi:hypothetical protein